MVEGAGIDVDKLLAGAIRYLIQGQELYEASILLLCGIRHLIYENNEDDSDLLTLGIEVLSDSRTIYDLLSGKRNHESVRINRAFASVVPRGYYFSGVSCSLEYPDLDSSWRETLMEVVEGKRALNQGVPIKEAPRFAWENLQFRSPVEITVAKSLDKYRVLFLPNCMARLGLPDSRENREADFLVCYEGKWGILEINGDAFHTSAAKDHDRGRLFKMHSIRVFEPYDAKRCMNEPDKVVREFLEILKKNG